MERRKFTREFKLEAVRLIKNRGVSYVQASQDFERAYVPVARLGEEVLR
jgi:transposase-like protein